MVKLILVSLAIMFAERTYDEEIAIDHQLQEVSDQLIRDGYGDFQLSFP